MKLSPSLVITVLFVAWSSTGLAAKTDVVWLINGNDITGEIKTLEFGALSYSTDSMGTVSIDWVDVTGVRSTKSLQVEMTDGTRYFGHLMPTDNQRQVRVITQNREVMLNLMDVVRLTPIDMEDSFWSRVDGSFSFGLTSEKSSEVSTFNLATDVQYRERKYLVGLTANASITEQPGAPNSQRSTIGMNYQRFRPNRWFTDWFASWETNQQLGIENRYIAGGGVGRYLIQTNRDQFSLTVGLNGTQESYVGDATSSTVAEGRVQARYLHRRLSPDARASLTTNVYPLLSDFSDYRSETDLSFRREFIEDLFLEVTLYHSYRSEPPVGAEKVDYGLTTSLGYSW